MTLNEILKSQGLTDEQIETVTGEMKQNKIFTSAEENIDIRHRKLQDDFTAKDAEHKEALALIEQLRTENEGNAALQEQITGFNTRIAQLEAENAAIKAETAAKMALLDGKAKAEDIDYLIFSFKKANEGKLELDENGKIKGLDIEALKTAHPNNFETETIKKVEPHKLGKGDPTETTITKEQFDKMSYKERVDLFSKDPATYDKFTK